MTDSLRERCAVCDAALRVGSTSATVRCHACGHRSSPTVGDSSDCLEHAVTPTASGPAAWSKLHAAYRRLNDLQRLGIHNGRILDVSRYDDTFGRLAALAPFAVAREVGPAGSFDAVTLWDGLDACGQPVDALKQLRAQLQPNGLLAVSAPVGRTTSTSIDEPLQYFTRESLELALLRAGLDVVVVRPCSVENGRWFGRVADRVAGVAGRAIPDQAIRWLWAQFHGVEAWARKR